MKSSVFLTAAFLACISVVCGSSSSGDGPNNNQKTKGGKKSEASKEEKANTKLPPCGACTNLVASFDQVIIDKTVCKRVKVLSKTPKNDHLIKTLVQ